MKELHTGTVVFNTYKGKKLVWKSQIAFVKADNKYLDFYTEQGTFTELTTLKALEAAWGNDWIRVHRNALVRKSAIRSLGEKLGVRCNGKVEMLEVSRRQRPEVRRWLKTLRVTQS
jgi:two-component system response regulator AlgR